MKLHAAALLAILCLGIFTVHTVKGSGASESMRKGSCVDLYTRPLSIRNLVSYEKQHIPVTAIVFMTKKGIKICVRPDQHWVQTAMKKIDQRSTSSRNGISQLSVPSETPQTRHHSLTPLPPTPSAAWRGESETQKVASQKENHDLKEASSVKETSHSEHPPASEAFTLPAPKTLTTGTEAPSRQLQ